MNRQKTKTSGIGVIRWTIAGYVLLGIVATYNAQASIACSADPNHNQVVSDPNLSPTKLLPCTADPNAAAVSEANSISGTLALNWLYQGKQPPTPVVGREKVSFRTGVHPWPYYYDRGRSFASSSAPWLCHPRDESDYWNAAGKDFTYPLNYAEVQMMLDTKTSLCFGAYFFSDPIEP
jgi:hypothetical protein